MSRPASEVIDPNRLSLHRIGDGADKNLVWDFEAEHDAYLAADPLSR